VDLGPEHPIEVELDNVDNLATLQKACIPLYQGAQCSKLVATMTLVHMCTIHGCSNKFVDELFSLLHKFILLEDNCLSNNMYGAKSLCQRVSLDYNKIHACIFGCILYKGQYIEHTHCPKCGSARYKHMGRTQVLVKVVCHFPITP
jgi:hypothetical protein